jgi:2-succinyl-5-enolpyruvyl-6-hydroxy-3-cyclohexene-1-carboxylate synthase
MLAAKRQSLIAEEIRRRGAVRVSELTELLGVSDMTIRRDLDVLAGSGLIDKVHGGATARRSLSTDEPGFDANSRRQFDEKEAIAQTAAALVEPGQAIALSAGTTTWRLAHHLTDVPDLTVVTNSMQIAIVLQREPRPDLTVVVVNDDGGSIFAMLEQGAPSYADRYDTLFGTPHGVDLAALCAATRTPHWRVESLPELEQALANPNGGIEVIEVRVRRDNRRQLDERIRALRP